jgi:hypothetical protein
MLQKVADRLEANGFRLIDSEYFGNTVYGVKDGELLIAAGKCGALRLNKDNIADFLMEVFEINNCYFKGGE